MNKSNYPAFFTTLLISFFIMYGVMFLNVDAIDHIYFSLTRFYMSLLMVSPMAILMIIRMPHMYNKKRINKFISVASIFIFAAALLMLRSQAFISDSQYMKAMIPHHSSAILTSKHAQLRNPQVKSLSESIIRSQEQEISEMKELIKKLDKGNQ